MSFAPPAYGPTHEGEHAYGLTNELGEFIIYEAVDESGRGVAEGVGANRFDRAGDKRLRVARAPEDYRPVARRARGEGIYVGPAMSGEAPPPPARPRVRIKTPELVSEEPAKLKLTSKELKRIMEAASSLLANDGMHVRAADRASVSGTEGALAAAGRVWRAAEKRGRGAVMVKPRARGDLRAFRQDDLSTIRQEVTDSLTQSFALYEDLVPDNVIDRWTNLIVATPMSYGMNMRFLAAALTWIYVHFKSAVTLAGRDDDLNSEFSPQNDPKLKDLVKRAKSAYIDSSEDSGGAASPPATDPTEQDYLVVFAYVVWLKRLFDGEFSALDVGDPDDVGGGDADETSPPTSPTPERAKPAPEKGRKLEFNPFDTEESRLAKASAALGEAHLSKTFQITGPGASPPPKLRNMVMDLLRAKDSETDSFAKDVANAIRRDAILIATVKTEPPGQADIVVSGRSYAQAPLFDPRDTQLVKFGPEGSIYFGGLAATLSAMRAIMARTPRLSEATTAAETRRIVNTKVFELFSEAFVPLSAAGALGRDFIGEFASHLSNPNVGYALVKYAARNDVRETALSAGAVYSRVTDAFVSDSDFEDHVNTLRLETEVSREKVVRAAAVARTVSDGLFYAKPAPVTIPSIESARPDVILESEWSPIELFARAKTVSAIALIQFSESESAASARSGFAMTPEFFSSYVIDALASEARGVPPLGWGLSAGRHKGGIRTYTKIRTGGFGARYSDAASLRAIVSAARSVRPHMLPWNTITFIAKLTLRGSEELAVASLIPVRREASADENELRHYVRLEVHSLAITEDEIRSMVIPEVTNAFPGLQLLESRSESAGARRSERIRGRISIVGKAAEVMSVPGFYFSIITLPALRPFFSINESKRAFSEKTSSPGFHIVGDGSSALGGLGEDDDAEEFGGGVSAVLQRSRARFRFDVQEFVPGEPGRTEASLPVTFFTHSASDIWLVAYVLSKAVGMYVNEISAPLVSIMSKITPGIFSAATTSSRRRDAGAAAAEDDESAAPSGSRSRRSRTTRRVGEITEAHRTIPRKITDLRANTEPGTIVANYDSLCACKQQPILITEDERDAWNGYKVLEYKNRLLACPDPNMPYPIVKPILKSKIAENIGKEFPCCYARPEREPEKAKGAGRGKRSSASAAAAEPDDLVVIGRAGYVVTKATSVDVGRLGILPSGFSRLIRAVVGKGQDIKFYRTGTIPNSPNSLIHAVLTALNTSGYNQERSRARREAMAESLRAKMRQLPTSIYAQEFPDLDPSGALRRRRVLEDALHASLAPNKALDSKVHVRGLEAVFDANVFIAVPAPDKTGAYDLEIPNYASAYLRPPAKGYDKTVVLVRISDVPVPHYEPIVTDGGVSMFTSELAKALTEVFDRTLETVRIDAVAKTYSRRYPFGVDIEYLISKPGEIFTYGAKVDQIHIDAHGKMRAIEVTAGASSGPDVSLTVFTPPLPPIAAPISGLRLRPPESGVPGGVVYGIDSSSDRPVPFAITDVNIRLIIASSGTEGRPRQDELELFALRWKWSSLIAQFVYWARMVARASAVSSQLLSLLAWWNRYIEVVDVPENELSATFPARSEFPDVKAILSKLPAGGDLTLEALRALEVGWPDFVKNGKIRIPSREVSHRLIRFLAKVENETYGLEELLDDPFGMVPKHVLGVFTRVSDFCVGMGHDDVLGMRIFTTAESFNDWVAHARGSPILKETEILSDGSENVTPLRIFQAGAALGGARPGAFLAEMSGGALTVLETHPGSGLRDAARSALRWSPGAVPAMWVVTKSRQIAPLYEALAGPGVLRLDAGEPSTRGAYTSVLPLTRGVA